MDVRHGTVETNGISMHVAEAGSGPLLVLLHGFPELWYSWRHQLPELARAGYHAVAPDQRGYGRTDAPAGVESYDVVHLTGDVTGLLDAMGEDRAVVVGHDWGAIVAWQLAVLEPDRVRAVTGLSVPFTPRPPVPPTELFRSIVGDRFFYILYFQEPGVADRELAADPRASMRKLLAGGTWGGRVEEPGGAGLLDRIRDPAELPQWLRDEDLDVYAGEFARTGFTGALNWYRNFDSNWRLTERVGGAHVTQPALFLTGERDPVGRFAPPEIMDGWVDDLRGARVLPGAGHWIQQERPAEVTDALVEFLAGLR